MDFPIKVTLKRPFTLDDVEHKELNFDEPDLDTQIAVEECESDLRKGFVLLAGMAGVSMSVLGKVKESDLEVINQKIMEPYQKEQYEKHGLDFHGGKKKAEKK